MYSHQEGAGKRYQPHKPGWLSHTDHTLFVAKSVPVLDVEVQAGNQTASKCSFPGLCEFLARAAHGRTGRWRFAVTLTGVRRRTWRAPRRRASPSCFKLRLRQEVKKIVERLMRDAGKRRQGAGTPCASRGLEPCGAPWC